MARPNPGLLAEAGSPSTPGAVAGALAGERLLPVAPALESLFPRGGLRRGSTVAVTGSTSLALAVLAGPSAAGSWCAAVGLPALGLVAAAEMGVVLDRLAMVPAPGPDWPAVVAALLDALDVVMVGVGGGQRVRPADARRLVARARERGAVLLVVGGWDGAEVRLSVADPVSGQSGQSGQSGESGQPGQPGPGCQWVGLEAGHGHLRARRVEVVAEGRGVSSRPRRHRLWLPAEGGGVEPA
ncbi:MAG TPA: hypothetical protein VM142_03995 [Acidimicrobiales bacterium]|nr:hypothetical protein [Acidimicrobiales bacterium]